MSNPSVSESAFETVIESHLLAHGYVSVAQQGFDRERAIFPATVLDFIRSTQPKEWELGKYNTRVPSPTYFRI